MGKLVLPTCGKSAVATGKITPLLRGMFRGTLVKSGKALSLGSPREGTHTKFGIAGMRENEARCET